MAPFDLHTLLGAWGPGLVAMLLGVGFGFSIERGGLGNAKRLAAQFYLTDLRVLKTMFTAIVTAMVLILLTTGLGWLDDSALWINPTYLWPGILGGLLLGVGFIVGGYCPGTSLVATATGKIDGMVFVVGVLVGTWTFGQTVPTYWSSWNHWGFMGRLTLHDLLGVPKHWLVLGIVLMALSWFVGAELLERWRGELPRPTRKAWRGMAAGAAALLGLALLGVAVGQPDSFERVALHRTDLDARLATRGPYVSADEVLHLMHDHTVDLTLLDVRPEARFVRFHLLDAEPLPPEAALSRWIAQRSPTSILLLVGDTEAEAEDAWRRLAALGAPRLYLLEGGLDTWLQRFGAEVSDPRLGPALGARGKLACPRLHGDEPSFTPKVKLLAGKKKGGGCG